MRGRMAVRSPATPEMTPMTVQGLASRKVTTAVEAAMARIGRDEPKRTAMRDVERAPQRNARNHGRGKVPGPAGAGGRSKPWRPKKMAETAKHPAIDPFPIPHTFTSPSAAFLGKKRRTNWSEPHAGKKRDRRNRARSVARLAHHQAMRPKRATCPASRPDAHAAISPVSGP
jgi:hypothetical protein